MAIGAWVRTRRVNVLKREKPHLCGISSVGRAPSLQVGGRRFEPVIPHQICLVSLMVKPRFEGPVISVQLGDQAPECYERPNGDRGLEVVAPCRKTRQEVRASQRSVWPPPEAVKWYAPAQYRRVGQRQARCLQNSQLGFESLLSCHMYTARTRYGTDNSDMILWFLPYQTRAVRARNMYAFLLHSTYIQQNKKGECRNEIN